MNARRTWKDPSVAAAAALAAAALVGAGCNDGSRTHASSGAIRAGEAAPRGPDATAGKGNTTVVAVTPTAGFVPNDDVVLANDAVRIGIEAVGMEFVPALNASLTAPMALDPLQPGLPINSFAPSGGNLVDIVAQGAEDDQFSLAAQAIGGFLSAGDPATALNPLATPVFNFEILPDTDPGFRDFLAENPALIPVLDSDNLARHVIVRGVIANNDAEGNSFDGTIAVPAGQVIDAAGALLPPAFSVNVPRGVPIVVEETTGIPIFVTTIYALHVNSQTFSILTIVSDPNPSPANTIGISNVVDIVLTGGLGARNLDTISGGPMFVPTPPSGYVQAELLSPTGLPNAVTENLPQIGTAPYVTFIGRVEPGASYTWFDPNVGALVVDERLAEATGLAQVRGARTIDDPATPQVEEFFSHLRFVSVGRRNDGASSLNPAMRAIANQGAAIAASGVPTPNTITEVVRLRGRVRGAPEGTVVTVHEVEPIFFSFFHPELNPPGPSGLPSGGSVGAVIPSFHGPETVPPTLPSPPFPPLSLVNDVNDPVRRYREVLRTTARLDAGEWDVLVPVGARVDGRLFAASFPPLAQVHEEEESTYIVRVHVPGASEPIELGPRTVRRGTDVVEFGTVDADRAEVGFVDFQIVDATPGRDRRLIPGKITALAPGGPLPFDLGVPTGLSDPLERASGSNGVVHSASGRGRIALASGLTYELVASAGTEWQPVSTTIPIVRGENGTLVFELVQAVEAPNALSLDAHVHSSPSFDSSAPLEDRVKSFLAAHVDVLVATDHDVITDIDPVIRRIEGARERLRGISGSEITSTVPGFTPHPLGIGHYTAFPLPFRKNTRKRGSPEDEFRPVSTLVQQVRAMNPDSIVNLAHPRASFVPAIQGVLNQFGFFENLVASPYGVGGVSFGDFDDAAIGVLLTGGPNPGLAPFFKDSLTFDTIELLTGFRPADAGQYVEVRRDWFDLTNRGIVKTGLGNTDSHRIDERGAESVVGFPRNYLLFSQPVTPRSVSEGAIVNAMKPLFDLPSALNAPLPYTLSGSGRQKVFVTTGPFFAELTVAAGAQSGTIGDVVNAGGASSVTVTARITGPEFVMGEVDSVAVYVNGELAGIFTLSQVESGASVGIPNNEDSYVVVEVGRDLTASDGVAPHPATPGSLYDRLTRGGLIMAIANPVFIENDGNANHWTPPGDDVTTTD